MLAWLVTFLKDWRATANTACCFGEPIMDSNGDCFNRIRDLFVFSLCCGAFYLPFLVVATTGETVLKMIVATLGFPAYGVVKAIESASGCCTQQTNNTQNELSQLLPPKRGSSYGDFLQLAGSNDSILPLQVVNSNLEKKPAFEAEHPKNLKMTDEDVEHYSEVAHRPGTYF